ncbi:MAG TPA: VOC family protein [Actinomycetota bacterium]
MASRFTELVVGCADPKPLGRFWSQVLDWPITEEDDESAYLEDPEDRGPSLLFIRVPEGKTVKNRLHIDVNPRGVAQQEEVERVLTLGARRIDIGQGPDVSWVVLADPEGNEFCILKTTVD